MSLMGIDVGTSGVKAVVFDEGGGQLAAGYEEYDFQRPKPGWAELDANEVWAKTQAVIRRCTAGTAGDPVQAISVSSMGEAMAPLSADRRILGSSINPNFDRRGEIFLPELEATMERSRLYDINGNTLGANYSLATLKWIKTRQPRLYERTDVFLLWSSVILTLLGGEPVVDYSLANRTLLFDLERGDWSDELLDWSGLDRDKLPDTVPSGTLVGRVSQQAAEELGLPAGAALVSGAHDQCANAVGCGVIAEGMAVFGMGTFFTITPVFSQRKPTHLMLERGLNTEHHAVPGHYVSFIYNLGGALIRWYRDTFAAAEHAQARRTGRDVYADLFAEMPPGPSRVLVLPHFGPTGPPEFISDSRGVIVGLQLDTQRGEILRGIAEGVAFYLKEIIDDLPPTGITIDAFRATGGGAKSDAWLQTVADIMGRPVIRPAATESSALGAAIMAGVGAGRFGSFAEGVEAMVSLQDAFEPDDRRRQQYQGRSEKYSALWLLMRSYLHDLATA